MTITYTWVIAQLDVAPTEDDLEQVVKTVHWRLQATGGTFNTDCYGSIGLGSPEPGKFTAYDSLTEATVISWLESALEVDQLKQNLAGNIEKQKNPPIVTPALPWQA